MAQRSISAAALALTLGLAATSQAADEKLRTIPKWTARQLAERIDAEVSKKLSDNDFDPAPRSSDAVFLRRVSLDIRGGPPSADEVIAFARDRAANKREAKIDEYLKDSGYAEHWADQWKRALIGRATTARRRLVPLFEGWLEDELAKNRPYDALVRDVLTAEGMTTENAAVAYTLRYEGKPYDLAGATARQFLGLQIQCAQCHDHPYTDTKQSDFLSMAAYFGRVGSRRMRQMGKPVFGVSERPRGTLKVDANMEPVKPRDWGRAISPKFMIRGLEGDTSEGYRSAYAAMVTAPENKNFSRMAANRVWSLLFGRGLVNPVEDLEQGETLHPELLDLMARAFVGAGFDLRWLIKGIALSETYQRSSRLRRGQKDAAAIARRTKRSKDADKREEAAQRAALERALFARAELRPLSPEQLVRSTMQATGLADLTSQRRVPGFRGRLRGITRQFTFTFDTGAEGEVTEFNGTIPQALLMMNSAFVNRALTLPQGAVSTIIDDYRKPEARIQRVFLSVLGRLPDSKEMRLYKGFIRKAGDDRAAYEDLAWVLMNSSEFLFNS